MVIIISDNNDQSTCHVIDWLLYYKTKYILITENDEIDIIELFPNGDFKIQIRNQIIESNQITSIWYRRGALNLKSNSIVKFDEDIAISNSFQRYINREKIGIADFINFCFLNKTNINNYLFSIVNKLVILKKAFEIGLKIPETIVTGNKDRLIEFFKKHNRIITKGAIDGLYFCIKDFLISSYTEEINNELINNLNNSFFPSLFQKKVSKLFEIRVFYLNDEFYSMAIFSQSNPKTATDFRHYDNEIPNRNVPFNLPEEIKFKIKHLMQSININSGSIDFIYGKDKQFYFLEINPIGQFGMTSFPCNYFLERSIARKLSNMYEK